MNGIEKELMWVFILLMLYLVAEKFEITRFL
jgi:hypothetical protein